jgi:hypothetical protein
MIFDLCHVILEVDQVVCATGEVGRVTTCRNVNGEGNNVPSTQLRWERKWRINKPKIVGVLKFLVDTGHQELRDYSQQSVLVIWRNVEKAAVENQAATFVVAFMLVCKDGVRLSRGHVVKELPCGLSLCRAKEFCHSHDHERDAGGVECPDDRLGIRLDAPQEHRHIRPGDPSFFVTFPDGDAAQRLHCFGDVTGLLVRRVERQRHDVALFV